MMDWKKFVNRFDTAHKRGQGYPAPANLPPHHYNHKTILEIVDSYFDTCYYKVYMDGQLLGGTDKKGGFRNDKANCRNDPDKCVTMGYGHGFFLIPEGRHTIQVEWAEGPLRSNGGFVYTHNEGYYRVHRTCDC